MLHSMLDPSSPNQGSNLCPLQWKHSLNHWTTRDVPRVIAVPYISSPLGFQVDWA